MTEICSSLRGVVAAVLVADGDHVTAGQDVVLVESMKMEYPMAAAVDGTVSSIGVSVGDPVNPGDVLVVLGEPVERPSVDAGSVAASAAGGAT